MNLHPIFRMAAAATALAAFAGAALAQGQTSSGKQTQTALGVRHSF